MSSYPCKDNNPQARIVYFRFSDGFIPLMVYYGACINRNIKQDEDLFWMRRHIIKLVLNTDQLYYVSLCEEHDSIRVAITPDEEGKVTSKGLLERWKLIEYFNIKLKEIVKTFMPASDLPQCYIPCCRCPNLHLKLDSIREINKRLNCVRGKVPKDYYSDLRQCQDVDEVTDMDANEVMDTGKLKVIFKKVPTMRKLVSYLKKLKNWESFGYFLLPKEHEDLLEEIKIDNEGKGINSCKIVLYQTFLRCGVKTWETVVNALEESDNDDMAKQVKMQLIKDYPS